MIEVGSTSGPAQSIQPGRLESFEGNESALRGGLTNVSEVLVMAFTLVLTRHPDNVFNYNTGVADTAANRKKFWFPVETGRFGTLVLFSGAKFSASGRC